MFVGGFVAGNLTPRPSCWLGWIAYIVGRQKVRKEALVYVDLGCLYGCNSSIVCRVCLSCSLVIPRLTPRLKYQPVNSRPSSRNRRRFAFRWEAHTSYSLHVRVYESSPISLTSCCHCFSHYSIISNPSDISKYARSDLDNPVIRVGKKSSWNQSSLSHQRGLMSVFRWKTRTIPKIVKATWFVRVRNTLRLPKPVWLSLMEFAAIPL